MKLNIDIANLRKKLMDKSEINDSDKDLQFIAKLLNIYSKMRQETYGSSFEYKLDVKIEDYQCDDNMDNSKTPMTTQAVYKTLEDYKGINLESFFSCSRTPEESKDENKESNEEEILSSIASSHDYTVSEYDFPQDDLTNSVNKTMTIAIIDINRSVIEKGVNIKNNITDQIVFVNDNNEIIEKCGSTQRTIDKSLEFIDQIIDLSTEELKEQQYFDQLGMLDQLLIQPTDIDLTENKHIGIPIGIPITSPNGVNNITGANVVIPLLQLEPANFHTHFCVI